MVLANYTNSRYQLAVAHPYSSRKLSNCNSAALISITGGTTSINRHEKLKIENVYVPKLCGSAGDRLNMLPYLRPVQFARGGGAKCLPDDLHVWRANVCGKTEL